ncbi:Lsr2 family DNA-binding protein [Streptomyces olivaceoviridis]
MAWAAGPVPGSGPGSGTDPAGSGQVSRTSAGESGAEWVAFAPDSTADVREELAAIRTWARANGHQIAAAGTIRKSLSEACHAAHRNPAAKGG